MDQEDGEEDLMVRAAAHNQVPVEVLRELMGLESEFPDFTRFGSKAEFTRRVAAVLDAAAAQSSN